MSVSVKRYKRHKTMGDESSPQLWYLRPVAGSHKIHDIESLAREIETTGAMSVEDVVHVVNAIVRRLKISLTQGNRVKIDKLGTFYLTVSCDGTEKEKDCTVKNIKRVNLRFKVDKTLRLVNDSTAPTRSENNVQFYIKSETGSDTSNGDNEEEYEDPVF